MDDVVPGAPEAMPRPIRKGALVGGAVAMVAFALLLSGGHADGLWREGPFTADFYDEQARALISGRLDVDPEVASIEGFRHDGRTYLYFGLVPALARVPIVAVTDVADGRLTQLSMLVALAVLAWASARLAWRARRARRADVLPTRWEPVVVGGFVALVGLGSPLLFLASRPLVYHETELWGAALALVAAEAVLAWWARPSGRRLVLAALAATLALNTRPSVGSLGVLALAVAVASRWRAVGARATARDALAVVVPVATYVGVNAARFGQLLSVPFERQVLSDFDASRQAALAANDGTLFNLAYIPTTLWHYVRPDGFRFQRLFPFVGHRDTTFEIGDVTFDVIDRAPSLPVVAPVLLVLAVVGLVACARARSWPWVVVTGAAGASVASTLAIGFIAARYLSDFTPVLVVPAAVGLWVLVDGLGGRDARTRRAALAGFGALAVAGLVVSAALALGSQRLYLLPEPDSQVGFVGFQHDLDERLRGGPPPGVAAVATLPDAVAADGEIRIVDRCAGLYRSDGDEWRSLELSAPLERHLEGSALEDGTVALVTSERWRITATVEGDEVRFAYVADGRPDRPGPVVARDVVESRPLVLVTDPSALVVALRAGEEHLAMGWSADADAEVRFAEGWSARAPATPLCDRLLERLEG